MDAPFPEGLVECWQDFLFGPKGKDRTLDDIFASPLCFPLQRRREMEKMHEIANRIKVSSEVVCELGCDKGGSIWAWLKAVPTIRRFIACEIRGIPYKHLFEKAFPKVDFLWLECSSYENNTIERINKWLGKSKINILFIDGDKTKFMEDFRAYRPLMSSPGVVFMHDIQDGEPEKAFKEVYRNGYVCKGIIDIEDYRDVLKKPLPHTAHDVWMLHWAGRSCGVGVIYI